MGQTKKRTRSGRERVNSRNAFSARRKEEAELSRLSKAVSEIPRLSNRFQIFRQNRRQKAKLLVEKENQAKHDDLQPPIFRANRFTDLPLSTRTLDGLVVAGFSELTEIQRNSIPQALAGRDVLAAAPTGSGKTLAFLVPLLEKLWHNKWNTLDGLGALVLSPTRELSMQIFEVLRSVARKHSISAGLVIGGKDFEGEREKVGHMNVLVATPGRMLHHMDHVAELDCSNLKLLVLDEADRILDMGFSKTLDAILANLPKERQTLLFSATQTKSIKALARLSLRNPEYVAISSRVSVKSETENETEKAETRNEGGDQSNASVRIVGTPVGLSQSYSIVAAHEKLSVLWSFIKTHLKSKMIIFLASGKQVRFVFDLFCKMRPGMSLLHIHGRMKQQKRADMYGAFCKAKSAALFATDVASRGLDFPDVEWVIQLDCPDDVGTYVHRVGRTARFKAQGRAMLLLCEGKEENFLTKLEAKNLKLHKTKINPAKITSVTPRVAATIASNQELKRLAQRAFAFYVRSVYQQADKEVFDVQDIDFPKLASSYGLSVAPKVSFGNTADPSSKEEVAKLNRTSVFGYVMHPERKSVRKETADQMDRGNEEKPQSTQESEDEDRILTVKKVHQISTRENGFSEHEDDEEDIEEVKAERRKRKKRKLDLLKSMPSANRIVFTEDGEARRAGDIIEDTSEEEAQHDGIESYAKSVAERLADTAQEDKDREKGRIQSVHARRKARLREMNKVARPSASSVLDGLPLDEVSSESDSTGSDGSGDEFSKHSETDGSDTDDHTMKDEEELALRILEQRAQRNA